MTAATINRINCWLYWRVRTLTDVFYGIALLSAVVKSLARLPIVICTHRTHSRRTHTHTHMCVHSAKKINYKCNWVFHWITFTRTLHSGRHSKCTAFVASNALHWITECDAWRCGRSIAKTVCVCFVAIVSNDIKCSQYVSFDSFILTINQHVAAFVWKDRKSTRDKANDINRLICN